MSGTLLTIVCALGAAHLAAYYAGPRAIARVLKALPILILAWTAWSAAGAGDGSYARLIAIGLVLSAVGDVSLTFANGFVPGLAAFFLAHCCYIAAFAPDAAATPAGMLAAVALLGIAVAMLRYLWPHVARLHAPVTVYVTALSLMAWCAIARATAPAAGIAAQAAAVGATVFLVSDGVLAVDRFARRFAGAHAVVMVTYYAAQILIARSTLGG